MKEKKERPFLPNSYRDSLRGMSVFYSFLPGWVGCSFLLLLFPSLGEGQGMGGIQDSVYNLMTDFFNSKSEAGKIETSKRFSNGLKAALNMEKSIEFSFDSLKKYKIMIESPDKQVRIFTWDVEAEDGTHSYYGFVQAYSKKAKKFIVHQLQDKSEGMKDPENAILDNLKWYGAYYYEIILVKHKRKKYYTLLGWDGNNRITNKRLVDVLYFTDKGFPKFGDAIFVSENGKIKRRLIFEYKAGVFMSLKYEEDRNAIVFDHLSPSEPQLEGMYSFYGPDFTYDMLEFKEGKWQYVKNVQGGNDKNKADKHWNSPK